MVTARLAVEAASPQGWHKYVGAAGDVIGVTSSVAPRRVRSFFANMASPSSMCVEGHARSSNGRGKAPDGNRRKHAAGKSSDDLHDRSLHAAAVRTHRAVKEPWGADRRRRPHHPMLSRSINGAPWSTIRSQPGHPAGGPGMRRSPSFRRRLAPPLSGRRRRVLRGRRRNRTLVRSRIAGQRRQRGRHGAAGDRRRDSRDRRVLRAPRE